MATKRRRDAAEPVPDHRKTPPAAPADHHDDELIDVHEAARLYGNVHESTFRRYVRNGSAPEPVLLGAQGAGRTSQTYRWWRSEVLAARAQAPRASQTDSSWRERPKDRRHERATSTS